MSVNKSARDGGGLKLWVRIVAIAMCALMLAGVVAVVIQYFSLASYALDGYSADRKVRVGMMYGSGVTTGYEVHSETGFNLGFTETNSSGRLTSVYQLSETDITVASDTNLAKSGRTYWVTGVYNSTYVGAYHVEIDIGGANQFAANYALIEQQLMALTDEVFPAMVGGAYVARVGNFANTDDAYAYLTQVQTLFPNAYVASPSGKGVCVMVPDTGKILFEYDDGSRTTSFCVTPRGNGTGKSCLVNTSGRQFEGIFEFTRYISGARDGVQVVNILTLDEYINGLLPWEISASWPLEALKAMAVASRTYSLSMLGRHSEYGFDICNGTHCQVYLGVSRATDATRRAVAETSGVVLTYNNTMAKTYYSAVTGGCTVAVADAWGGYSQPYLRAIWTPWENYADHQEGLWQTEVTPRQLANALRSYGYNTITGDIVDVSIDELCDGSTYIYKITFTDENGGTAAISTSDRIRTVLQSYVNSANFVVVHGGEQAVLVDHNIAGSYPYATSSPSSASYSSYTKPAENVIAATGSGQMAIDAGVIYIQGADGTGVIASSDLNNVSVATAYGTSYANLGGTMVSQSTVSVGGSYVVSLSDLPVYTSEYTVEAEGDEENFVFVGRGWGHGVGMSQYGALNLAQMGYDYATILLTYYPGTKLVTL